MLVFFIKDLKFIEDRGATFKMTVKGLLEVTEPQAVRITNKEQEAIKDHFDEHSTKIK